MSQDGVYHPTTDGSWVCAIVPARDESSRIGNVLRQLRRAGVGACVVVCNGCRDDTAAVARELVLDLFPIGEVVEVNAALGPDVGRAYGTYWAQRRYRKQPTYFLYVDGDWGGGFGPALAAFLAEARDQGSLVHYSSTSTDSPISLDSPTSPRDRLTARLDITIWQAIFTRLRPQLASAAVSELPLLVQRDLFRKVSTHWLHHPGLWLAHCLRAGVGPLTVASRAQWDPAIRGNRIRSWRHAEQMRLTLAGDAVEAARLLFCRPPGRWWKGRWLNGYAAERRLDLLTELRQSSVGWFMK
jgi:hypothetical protein